MGGQYGDGERGVRAVSLDGDSGRAPGGRKGASPTGFWERCFIRLGAAFAKTLRHGQGGGCAG